MSNVNQRIPVAIITLGVAGLGLVLVDRVVIANADSAPPHSATTDAAGDRGPGDKAARQRALSPMQYHVTQEDGTEPPFHNEYWNNHRPGIYVDIVSGEPLFLSTDKYDSGTGWPSFTRPIEPGHLVTKSDHALFAPRVEVRSARADSHLGHVFDDGPPPTGQRYCMNSAALRFVPAEQMAAAGYGQYLPRLGRPAPQAPAKGDVRTRGHD
jgi:methionine-R-sulfoxide reductase